MRATSIAVLLGVALSGQLGAQTVTARVGGELTGVLGEQITVPIAVDLGGAGGEKLGSYTARLAWNTAVLSLCSYYQSGCDSLGGNFPLPQINNDSISYGVLRFTAISPVGVGGLVTLDRFAFTVLSTTSSPLNLSFSEMSAAGTFTNLLPSLSVTSATFCSARGRWGDLDRDGQANSRDALAIISKVVGLPVNDQVFDVTMGDVDADTKVDSRDALIVLSYAVGLDVPGQRVLLPVPSTCGTGSASQLTVLPATAQLVPQQNLRMVAQAVDGAGRAVSVSGTTWRTSNYDVASVNDAGLVSPHAPGTAVITAEVGPGIRASSTITVIGRRPNWYVDVRATGAPLQLGTPALPFEHPAQAYPILTEGDTIRIATGVYFFEDEEDVSPYPQAGPEISQAPAYTEYAPLTRGAVMLGGTPGDTMTRAIFRPSISYGAGLRLAGGQRTVLRNIVFDGFDTAIDIEAVRTLVLEDVVIRAQHDNYSYGIQHCGSATMDTLRVDRTAIIGDSLSPEGYGIYFGGCADQSAQVTLIRDSKVRFWDSGIYLYDADSTVVLRSDISDNSGSGITVYQENSTTPALYVAHSSIERNGGDAIVGYPFRRVVIDSSRIRSFQNNALDLQGGCCGNPPMQLYMHGDSIDFAASESNWLEVDDADTVAIDSLWFRNSPTAGYEGSDINANYVRLTNSTFLNVSGNPFDVSTDHLVVDRTTFSGCPTCGQGIGVHVAPRNTGPIVSVTNSTFQNLNFALAMDGGGDPTSRLLATGNTVDRVVYGFNFRADSAVVADNRFSDIPQYGIVSLPSSATGPWKQVAILRNQLSCLPGQAPYAITVHQQSARVEDNGIRDCFQGIRLENASGAFLQNVSVLRDTMLNTTGQAEGVRVIGRWRPVVSRNRIVLAYTGIDIETTDTGTVRIDSNAVSQSNGAGIYLDPSDNVSILGVRNNIANNFNGMVVEELGPSGVYSFTLGSFTGNTNLAVDNQGGPLLIATQNWWGSPAGPPASPAPNGISVGVNATSPLGAAPTDVPSLAPPFSPVAGSRVAARAPTPAMPARPSVLQRRQKVAGAMPALRPDVPADQVARIRQERERRAAQEQSDRDRRAVHERRRAAREAARVDRQ